MGIAYKLIHEITSRIPISWHRKFSIFYSKHACTSILKKKGFIIALAEILFGKYTGTKAYQLRKKKLTKIRKKEIITVVFQVWSLAKWKCDSVYRAMKKHPRFNPVIWITDDPTSPLHEQKEMRTKMESFFSKPGYQHYYAENREMLHQMIKPDITFIQEPYEYNQDAINSILNGDLLCFVCYYISNTISKSGHTYFLYLTSLLRFVENESVYTEISKVLKNKGRNLAVVGHPILDYLRGDLIEKRYTTNSTYKHNKGIVKTLIWAPHWTITNESFYSNGTFLSICDDMIRIAKKYTDKIRFIFKPHPTLYRTLCSHDDWGKAKTEKYYRQWETMPNTQIETGEYRELFWSSDAIIHDCGSFIIEYPIVNKPCLYLERDGGYQKFNDFAKAALTCYTIGKTVSDIETFITEQVLRENDPKREARNRFIQQYLSPHNGKTAAENIIDAILGKAE